MLYLRGSNYQFRRRVPLRFKDVEPREVIALSLHTDSRRLATHKATELWEQLVEGWEAAKRGDSASARVRYEAAREIADRRGFSYMAATAVADLPLDEIIARTRAIPLRAGKPIQRFADALGGGVEEVGLTISEALEEFWKIAVDRERGKTADQIRRWRNPRIKAINNFVAVVGDKPVADLTRSDFKQFRDWWNARIDAEGLTPNSANKDFTNLAHTLRTVDEALGLELNLPVGKLAIKETVKGRRLPFSDKWIKAKLLAKGALDGLNIEARTILLTCINTGARPSEIAGLMTHHVHLDGAVPYIEIAAEGRQLKNEASARRIPLVGVSFTAMKTYKQPRSDGALFPTYFGKDALSATVNKYLRENGLLESAKHTLYGLRHSFEDRMTAAEPAWPERMKCDVFGHAIGRQRYGEGASLDHIYRRMVEIAL